MAEMPSWKRQALLSLGGIWLAALAGLLAVPFHAPRAQATDSTGMPSLEVLALEAGRASRRHPIRAVAHDLLCQPDHPLADSASLAACAALDPARATAIVAAFARGLEVPVLAVADSDAASQVPFCPTDRDRVAGPRALVARITAPVVGTNDGRWEGRLTVELRCRPAAVASGEGIRTPGKEYLYQWSGSAWRLYQFAWLGGAR
jgi:hypothetical protein